MKVDSVVRLPSEVPGVLHSVESLLNKVLCTFEEFKESSAIHMGDKSALNALNKNSLIRFPISNKKIGEYFEKASILIQCAIDRTHIEAWKLKQESSMTLKLAQKLASALVVFIVRFNCYHDIVLLFRRKKCIV